MNSQVVVSKGALTAFCRENGIKWFAVYGSALRSDFGPESDVDVLAEFKPDYVPGLIGLARIELELSELFSGAKWTCARPTTSVPTSGRK